MADTTTSLKKHSQTKNFSNTNDIITKKYSAKQAKDQRKIYNEFILPKIKELNNSVLTQAADIITEDDLMNACIEYVKINNENNNSSSIYQLFKLKWIGLLILIIGILFGLPSCAQNAIASIMGIRCFIPNNYIIWEASRPITDCNYCRLIKRPVILPNVTQKEFSPYAYSLTPIIVKQSASHWPARKLLNIKYIKELYEKYPKSLEHFQDECQFLSFKSNIFNLNDLFQMSDTDNIKPWYVGFSNCQREILFELRKLYSIPHFLPADAEYPNTDYIFLGYDQGAIMHLDYIPRLMWQAQLRGNKTWNIAPTPECDHECTNFSFYVEPGDIVLVDTRIWYHSTSIGKGEFSITIQSEYG